jgi:hypothetical protein
VTITCLVLHAGSSPGSIDAVQISGAVDQRRLRPGVPMIVSTRHTVARLEQDAGKGVVSDVYADASPLLIEEFSTRPLPQLMHRHTPDGRLEVTMHPKGLGRRGAITYFRRLIARNVNNGQPETKFRIRHFVSVPAELQVVTLLVPRDWADPATVECECLGIRHDPADDVGHPTENLLPRPAEAVHLGRGVAAVKTPEISRYPQLIGHVLEEAGWDPSELEAFGVTVPYPMLHTRLALSVGK